MDAFKIGLREKVEESAAQIEEKGWKAILKK
jgi:5-(carboxyamino)imidazole ribonucleotide mutase